MNILDIILLICFIPALVQGIRKGFIAQAISIISIIVGIWASARFADVVAAWVAQYITASEQVMKIVAFALILIVVFFLLGLLGKALRRVQAGAHGGAAKGKAGSTSFSEWSSPS